MVISNSLHDLLEPIRNKLRLIVGENLIRQSICCKCVNLHFNSFGSYGLRHFKNPTPHFKCASGVKKKNFPRNFQKNLFNMLQWLSRLTPKMEQS